MVVSVVNTKKAVPINLKHLINKCLGSMANTASESDQNQKPLLLLGYFTLLCIPLFLFTFRSFDDNRLVSWVWGFSQPYFSKPELFSMWAVLALVLALLFVIVNTQWWVRANVVSLFVVSFLISIPFWQTPEIIIDNARYFTQAKYVELYGVGYFFREWGQNIFAWTDLPLLPLIYGLAFKFFGEHRVAIQVLSSAFFAGTVAITYLLGKALWGPNHGITAAILLLGIPYLYTQIPLMMVDIPTMFFLTLAVLTSVLAIKEGGYYIAIASVAIVLALFTKYSAWIFLSVVPFAVFAQPQPYRRKNIFCMFKIGSAVAILILLALYWYYPILVEQLNVLLNYQWGALGRWQESNVSTFLFHVHPLISIAAFISLFIALKNRDNKFLIASWMLILVVLLDIQRIRYLVIVFPMLVLMAGYAVAEIPNIRLKQFMVCGVVLTSYAIALSMSTGFLQNTSASNLKSAGAFLDNIDVELVEVLVLPQQRSIVNPQIAVAALDYHTNKTLLYLDGEQPSHSSDISKSPVRFTWEYPIPDFYQNTHTNDHAKDGTQKVLAVIYSDKEQIASSELQTGLKDYRLIKRFQAQTGVFKYKTLINLYVPI